MKLHRSNMELQIMILQLFNMCIQMIMVQQESYKSTKVIIHTCVLRELQEHMSHQKNRKLTKKGNVQPHEARWPVQRE